MACCINADLTDVGDSDRPSRTVVGAGGSDHPGVYSEPVGQAGQQRERANSVGQHAVRGGYQTSRHLTDRLVVAVADILRFDAAR
jgi:hypothetical protein